MFDEFPCMFLITCSTDLPNIAWSSCCIMSYPSGERDMDRMIADMDSTQ